MNGSSTHPDPTLAHLFALQVEHRPDDVAVVGDIAPVSFRELDERSNRLARLLIAQGVGPEVAVALWLDRSVDFVVAALAVVKAGGVYVPVDVGYPASRAEFMMADARVRCVVTTVAARLSGQSSGAFEVVIDDPKIADEIAGYSADAVPDAQRNAPLRPDHAAYVIFTSGSTGRPKGVVVTHRNVVNLVRAQATVLGLGPGKRRLQFASVSFDASVSEVWTTLLSGAALVVTDGSRLVPGRALVETVRTRGVTHVTLPPSLLGAVEAEGGLPDLVTLVVAGEACPPAVVARWSRQPPDVQRVRAHRDHGRGHRQRPADRRGHAARSAGPSTTSGPTSSTRPACGSPSACPVSCTSPAPAWRAATPAGPR